MSFYFGPNAVAPDTSSASSSPSGLADIIKQMQDAQDKANAANESRYQDILKSYDTLGTAGMTRIGQEEQQAQAKGTQDLTSRGLGNTTITSAVNRGIASDAENSRQQLTEQVAQLKGGVMERKTDQGPDLGLYANLIQQMSRGQQGSVMRAPAPDDSDWFSKFAGPNYNTSSSAMMDKWAGR